MQRLKKQNQKNQGDLKTRPLYQSPSTSIATSDKEIVKIIEFSTKQDYDHWYPHLIEEIEKQNKLYQEYPNLLLKIENYFTTQKGPLHTVQLTYEQKSTESIFQKNQRFTMQNSQQLIQLTIGILEIGIMIQKSNISHNNIKPSNLIYYNGKVLLTDYGSRRTIERNYVKIYTEKSLKNWQNQFLAYQCETYLKTILEEVDIRDENWLQVFEEPDIQADIWALGIVILQLFQKDPYKIPEDIKDFYGLNRKRLEEQIFQLKNRNLEIIQRCLTSLLLENQNIIEVHETLLKELQEKSGSLQNIIHYEQTENHLHIKNKYNPEVEQFILRQIQQKKNKGLKQPTEDQNDELNDQTNEPQQQSQQEELCRKNYETTQNNKSSEIILDIGKINEVFEHQQKQKFDPQNTEDENQDIKVNQSNEVEDLKYNEKEIQNQDDQQHESEIKIPFDVKESLLENSENEPQIKTQPQEIRDQSPLIHFNSMENDQQEQNQLQNDKEKEIHEVDNIKFVNHPEELNQNTNIITTEQDKIEIVDIYAIDQKEESNQQIISNEEADKTPPSFEIYDVVEQKETKEPEQIEEPIVEFFCTDKFTAHKDLLSESKKILNQFYNMNYALHRFFTHKGDINFVDFENLKLLNKHEAQKYVKGLEQKKRTFEEDLQNQELVQQRRTLKIKTVAQINFQIFQAEGRLRALQLFEGILDVTSSESNLLYYFNESEINLFSQKLPLDERMLQKINEIKQLQEGLDDLDVVLDQELLENVSIDTLLNYYNTLMYVQEEEKNPFKYSEQIRRVNITLQRIQNQIKTNGHQNFKFLFEIQCRRKCVKYLITKDQKFILNNEEFKEIKYLKQAESYLAELYSSNSTVPLIFVITNNFEAINKTDYVFPIIQGSNSILQSFLSSVKWIYSIPYEYQQYLFKFSKEKLSHIESNLYRGYELLSKPHGLGQMVNGKTIKQGIFNQGKFIWGWVIEAIDDELIVKYQYQNGLSQEKEIYDSKFNLINQDKGNNLKGLEAKIKQISHQNYRRNNFKEGLREETNVMERPPNYIPRHASQHQNPQHRQENDFRQKKPIYKFIYKP